MAKTLLVIDDSSTIREAVQLALTGEEWEAVTATNGEEAAAALAQRQVDAILCDVAPGEEDGYELCRNLGSSAAGTGIPILLMGGSVNATAALAVGASSTLPKPFAATQLVQALSETLEQGDFSFDFDDVPVAQAHETSGEPEAAEEEFELESTAYAVDDLEIDEIEVIDLSDEGEFDDLELLDDLSPVELTPIQDESADAPFAIEPEIATAPAQEETVTDTEGPGLGELLEPTVGDFPEEPEPEAAEPTRPDDVLDLGLEEMDDIQAAPAEPMDLSDILGAPEAAASSDEETTGEEEYGVVASPAAKELGEEYGEFELPEATSDEIDVASGEQEPAEEVAAAFEFEDWEISDDAFDADLLPEADSAAEAQAEPVREPEETAVQDTALDIESLREVGSVDFGLEDLEEEPEQEASSPADEPAYPGLEGQVHPVAPEPQEDWSAAESRDDEWRVSIDDAPPTPAWDEVPEDEDADLPESLAAEVMGSETEQEVAETEAPGWDVLEFGSVPNQESSEPAPEEPVAEPREDLSADVAATAGRAVREALERSLSAEQLAPVIAAAVERVAWEVVPQLAERLIRETIEKLQQDPPVA